MFGRGSKKKGDSPKARVLMIAPRIFYLGGDRDDSLYARCQALNDLNLEVDLICYGDGVDAKWPNITFRRGPKTKLEDLTDDLSWRRKSVLDNKLFFKTYFKMLFRRYHAVYAQDEGILVALRLAKFFKTPEILYDRQSDLIEALERFALPELSAIRRRYENLEGRALKESTVILSSDPQSAESIVKKLGPKVSHLLIEDSFRVAPNLTEEPDLLEEFDTNVMLSLPEGRPIIGFMGTMGPEDGIDILIETFHEIRRQRPDSFLLVIGGNKPQVKTFHTLAGRLGLEEDCLFTGRVPSQLASAYLKRMDLRILPATAAERTLPEHYRSLSQGCPLLVTDIPAHRAVFHSETVLFSAARTDSLAKGALEILDNAEATRQRTEMAKAHYLANFSREMQTEKMKRAFEILAKAATQKAWERRQKKEDKKKRGKKDQSDDGSEALGKRAFQGRS